MAKVLRCLPSVRIGQVVARNTRDGVQLAKVRFQDMKLDKNILMYFQSKRDKWCVDKLETREGDIVVVRNLDKRLSKTVWSKVDSILYKVGSTIDPVTGRPCRGTDFIDEIPSENKTMKTNKNKSKETAV